MIERLKRTNTLGPYRNWMDSMQIIAPDQVSSKLSEGYKLLDVRPTFEVEGAPLTDPSVHIPLYEKASSCLYLAHSFLSSFCMRVLHGIPSVALP